VTIRPALPEDREVLVDIWLRSVRATHSFLTESDIQSLLLAVRDQALPALELWLLIADDGAAIGFLGVDRSAVEALFIAPGHQRRGGGRKLVEHARRLARERALAPLTVDVNEQNPEAVRFYEACGFEVTGRSPVDAAGRPFPLLHLRESENRG
jgi:putative acetyltransferase